MTTYFNNLFTSSPSDFRELFEGFVPNVSPKMNGELVKEVFDEEIVQAVFSFRVSCAPGTDGITVLFFKDSNIILVKQ